MPFDPVSLHVPDVVGFGLAFFLIGLSSFAVDGSSFTAVLFCLSLPFSSACFSSYVSYFLCYLEDHPCFAGGPALPLAFALATFLSSRSLAAVRISPSVWCVAH